MKEGKESEIGKQADRESKTDEQAGLQGGKVKQVSREKM
jgi:hypothetical protein